MDPLTNDLAIRRLELRYSLGKSGFGIFSCLLFGTVVVLFCLLLAMETRSLTERIAWGGLAAFFLVASLYGIPYYFRQFFDRSVKLFIDEEGIDDAKRPGRRVRWSQVREIGLRGKRRLGTVEWASLELYFHGSLAPAAGIPDMTISIGDLDREPEFIHGAAESMWKSRIEGGTDR